MNQLFCVCLLAAILLIKVCNSQMYPGPDLGNSGNVQVKYSMVLEKVKRALTNETLELMDELSPGYVSMVAEWVLSLRQSENQERPGPFGPNGMRPPDKYPPNQSDQAQTNSNPDLPGDQVQYGQTNQGLPHPNYGQSHPAPPQPNYGQPHPGPQQSNYGRPHPGIPPLNYAQSPPGPPQSNYGQPRPGPPQSNYGQYRPGPPQPNRGQYNQGPMQSNNVQYNQGPVQPPHGQYNQGLMQQNNVRFPQGPAQPNSGQYNQGFPQSNHGSPHPHYGQVNQGPQQPQYSQPNQRPQQPQYGQPNQGPPQFQNGQGQTIKFQKLNEHLKRPGPRSKTRKFSKRSEYNEDDYIEGWLH